MKIAKIIVRTLIGLFLLMASITYFLNIAPPPENLTGDTKTFFDGITASKYILPVAKFFELICGLAFVSGRYVALAVILIFPIVFNILFINAMHLPSGLPIVIPLFLGILFLAFTEGEKYMPLLESK
jgi:putative oxidoreductase